MHIAAHYHLSRPARPGRVKQNYQIEQMVRIKVNHKADIQPSASQ